MTFEHFLEASPIFAGLTNKDIEDFQRIMCVHHYPDNYEFFKEGKHGHDVHLIIQGKVNVAHKSNSRHGPLEIRQLNAGEMFGLSDAICNRKHAASCCADGPVTVATMPDSSFRLLHSSTSTLGLHFQQLVVTQLSHDYRSLVDLLRHVIFESDDDYEALDILARENISYSGPERRHTEERRQNI